MVWPGYENLPLAIVGMACRFPGAENVDEYWKLIHEGRTALCELPPERLDRELYYHPAKGTLGKTYSTIGGVVPDRPFRQEICQVPDELIALSDPAHLSMLEVAASACRDAGFDPNGVPLPNTGAYIGHARGSTLIGDLVYATHIEEIAGEIENSSVAFANLPAAKRRGAIRDLVDSVRAHKPHRLPGGGPHLAVGDIAALITNALDLTGPYMAIDAACASSLYALSLAGHALQQGRIDMAIVGGASYSSWQSLVVFSHAQALSASRSCPFDNRADGFVSSDGYACVIVKTLPRALADGDRIRAIVSGVGISNDGRGRSLWAPRQEGQVQAIRRAYGNSGREANLQYIEAHGTSTQLGDATEIRALTEALGDRWKPGVRLPVASVKANIGHTRESAGLAGLIKTVLAMEHGVVPPAANFEIPNKDIEWDAVPFEVPRTPMEWPVAGDSGCRYAGVDAFGIGGLNVHVALECPAQTVLQKSVPTALNGHARTQDHLSLTTLVPNGSAPRDTGRRNEKIAIVGMGAIFAGARTICAFHDLLSSSSSSLQHVPADRWDAGLFYDPDAVGPWRSRIDLGGFITDFEYDWKKHKIPPNQIEAADVLQFMLLDAADQALQHSGYDIKDFNRRNAGVVVGSMFGGDFNVHLSLALRLPELQRDMHHALVAAGVADEVATEIVSQFRESFLRAKPMLHDETGSFSSSTLASRVAKTLDLMGGAMAIDAAEASSFAALEAASDLLLSRSCDTVFCAGAQRAMDITAHEAYALRGWLNGCALGEGVGMLLLKRLSDAERDGDTIHGIIHGIGVSANKDSVSRALNVAAGEAAEVSRLERAVAQHESAGPGVVGFDIPPTNAEAAFPALGSIAPIIGYTLGASGMAEIIKSVVSSQMSSQCGEVHGVNGYAARGLAYHAIVEPVSSQRSAASATDYADGRNNGGWRIARMGAPDLSSLERLLVGNGGVAAATDARDRGFSSNDRSRLAIVAKDTESLEQKLARAASQLHNPAARPVLEEQGIFCRENAGMANRPRLAFVFPGQGSQYVGMLRELTSENRAAAALMSEANDIMASLGYSSFQEIAWQEPSLLGTDVWLTQVAILIGDLVVHAALKERGIRPDVVSAHSYGEYPALVACGAWTLEQAIRITRARCDAIEASASCRGVMFSTNATVELVTQLAAEVEGGAYVANHNAPDQVVMGGEEEAALQMQKLLQREGFETTVLPVPRPFHTPLMAGACDALRLALEAETILPPQIPLLSSVTNRYVSDPEEIKANLVRQLTEPVRYVDLVQRLVADGATAIVECGPRQVLTRLHRRIAPESEAVFVAADNPKRPGTEQLFHVQAALECGGVVIGVHEAETVRTAANAQFAVTKGRGEIVHFDATEKRRNKMRLAAGMTNGVNASLNGSSNGAGLHELELPINGSHAYKELGGGDRNGATVAPVDDPMTSFLVNFVCEQTGYPPEIVDLDADMEADLGIDSIKKAQLFGELREHFDIKLESTGRLSLDDFPTLSHVAAFLRRAGVSEGIEKETAAGQIAEVGQAKQGRSIVESLKETAHPKDERDERRSHSNSYPDNNHEANLRLNVIECNGSPYEMGRQHARSQKEHIVRLIDNYESLLKHDSKLSSKELRSLLDGLMEYAAAFFDARALEELQGMADEIGAPASHMVALNLGMYSDYGAGCAQFAIASGSGVLHGANEDWPLSLKLPGNLTRVIQIRRPREGLAHVLFGVAGQTGALNGINSNGLSVTSTMLLDRDKTGGSVAGGRNGIIGGGLALNGSQSGGEGAIIHSVLVGRLLETATDIESAIEMLKTTRRTGAWSLCLAHAPSGRIAYVEYQGNELNVDLGPQTVASTNHSLLGGAGARRPARVADIPVHSLHRLERLRSLLGGEDYKPVSLTQAQEALRDRYDLARRRVTKHPTMNTVRRVDNQLSVVFDTTNGAAWVASEWRRKGKELKKPKEQVDAYERLDLTSLLKAQATTSSAGASIDDSRIMKRFVLRMEPGPLETKSAQDTAPRSRFCRQHVVVLGQSPTSSALSRWLIDSGAFVHNLTLDGPAEESLQALDAVWARHPTPHLFILTARDEEAVSPRDQAAWDRRRERGVLLPYLLCQRWMGHVKEAGLTGHASVVALTALGGDFGFSGHVEAPEGGALTGLVKAIRHEFRDEGFLVKAIDFMPQEPCEAVVAAVDAEFNSTSTDVEVGYIRGRRSLVRAVPRPAPKSVPAVASGAWVVTGGARGITAVVARELAARFCLDLHLIGSSPAPDAGMAEWDEDELKKSRAKIAREARRAGRDPEQVWAETLKAWEISRTLQALSNDGIKATYHSCNVADRKSLARVLDRVRSVSGPIRGVIHGAGFEASSRFDRKKEEQVRATIAAKVDGAEALMELTCQDPLAHFVAFGSVSGRFGNVGQTDYSLASDMLCKLVQRFRQERPECASVSIHWPAWGEVGMAARPESKLALEMSGSQFMPTREGVAHLIDELCSGAPEGEVLIDDGSGHIDLDGILPDQDVQRNYQELQNEIAIQPLTEGVGISRRRDSLVAEVLFDPQADPFLQQHRIGGVPLLPAVVGIEALAEAASLAMPGGNVAALKDVEIQSGLRFYGEGPLRVEVEARGSDEIDCELRADFRNREGRLIEPQRVYLKGRAETESMSLKESITTGAKPSKKPHWHDMAYLDAQRAAEECVVHHGPAMRQLRRIALESEGGWGEIVAPSCQELIGRREGSSIFPLAALDACLVACAVYARKVLGAAQLPQSFGLLIPGPLPEAGEVCMVRFDYLGLAPQGPRFDFALFGADGEPVLVAKDHRGVFVTDKRQPDLEDAQLAAAGK